MIDPKKAFESEDGFIVVGGSGFFSAPVLPDSTANFPEGSLFILTNGKQYVKSGSKWAINKSGVGIRKIGLGESVAIEENEESVLTRKIIIRGSLVLKGRLTIL